MGFSFKNFVISSVSEAIISRFRGKALSTIWPLKKIWRATRKGRPNQGDQNARFLETHAGWYDIEFVGERFTPSRVGYKPQRENGPPKVPKKAKKLAFKGFKPKRPQSPMGSRQLANRGMSFLTLWHPKNGFWGSILGPILMRESLPSPFFWTTPIANHNRFLYRQLQGLFDSLFRVLFTFPLRYLWAIGLPPRYLALDGMYHPFSGSTLKLPYS